jgi:hypothetical protein
MIVELAAPRIVHSAADRVGGLRVRRNEEATVTGAMPGEVTRPEASAPAATNSASIAAGRVLVHRT